MAYGKYTPAEIVQIEDRLRTVTENLRAVRQLAESSPSGTVTVQLASCDPLLKRLEALTFNAVAAARSSQYNETRTGVPDSVHEERERLAKDRAKPVKKKKGE